MQGNDTMDVFACMASRRSIRSFTAEAVTDAQVHAILEAGTMAPSAGNMQAREFVLVRSPLAKQAVADTSDAGITARGKVLTQTWIATADVIIVICYDPRRMGARYGEKGRTDMSKLDCMGVAQNMMLAVTALGLGTTCVIGFDAVALKHSLGIPAELTPMLLLPIGHPAAQGGPVFRLAPEELVRFTC
jgi:nitroreductase